MSDGFDFLSVEGPDDDHEGLFTIYKDTEVAESEEEAKTGPVVNRRKREGIQLCNVYNPAKPPKWKQVIYEPKEDGYRSLVHIDKEGDVQILSSTGLPHYNVHYLRDQVAMAAATYAGLRNTVLDGEITHRYLDFDTAGGIMRKHDIDDRADGFILTLWDLLPKEEFDAKTCSIPLLTRKTALKVAVERLESQVNNRIYEIPWVAGKIEEAEAEAKKWRATGREGIVMKDADSVYQFRKSSIWLKWKPEIDENGTAVDRKDGDLLVIGATEGRGKNKGMVGALMLRGYLQEDENISPYPEDGGKNQLIETEVGTGFTNPERIDLWARLQNGTLINQLVVEVKYKYVTIGNALREPAFYRLREDK